MMKRRNIVLMSALAIIVVVGLSITAISAYFISRAHIENIARAGYGEEQIEEAFENPDIVPDQVTTITKKVCVINTGPNTVGVRIAVEFSSDDVLTYTAVDYNTDDWVKSGNYWYYSYPVASGERTEPLFSELTLRNPTADQVRDFDVYVYSECRACAENATMSDIKNYFSN